MMKKNVWMGVMLAAVLMVPSMAFAGIIVDSGDFDGFEFTMIGGTETFIVHSWVEDSATSGYYRYYYEILEPGFNIQWFSVELLDGASVVSLKAVPSEAGDPAMWSIVGDNDSVDAFYTSPVSPDQDSTVLWFDSEQLPTIVDGSASGITAGVYRAFEGQLYSPVPEPATLALLAIGSAVCVMGRKRA